MDLSGEGEAAKPGRIIVGDPAPAGGEVLDAALRTVLAHQGKQPSTVIRPLGNNLRQTLCERLAGSGVVRAGPGRTLGIVPARRWPAQDASREAAARQLVIQALVQQRAPGNRTAALTALVHAVNCEHKIVGPRQYGLSGRQLRARAEEIAKGSRAAEAVRKATGEMIAAAGGRHQRRRGRRRGLASRA